MVSIGSLMNDRCHNSPFPIPCPDDHCVRFLNRPPSLPIRDFSIKVERTKLDELCADLYTKIAGPIKEVLAQSKLQVKAPYPSTRRPELLTQLLYGRILTTWCLSVGAGGSPGSSRPRNRAALAQSCNP